MKLRFWLSAIPDYARLPLVFVVIWNQAVYCGSKLLAAGWSHYDLTTAFDRATPFLPWTVSVYLASCVFWVLCYIYCASQEKRQAYRCLCADFLAKAVCLVFFLLLPTTNVRPAIEESSLWCVFMRILYQMDSPTNLFPSIHCLVSWLCFLGVRDAPRTPKAFRYGAFCMAVAIFLSTLTTKQHVVVDVLGGVLLAQISYWAANKAPVLSRYSRLADCLSQRRR